MSIKDALRRHMEEQNIGNKELSVRSGVPQKTVNNLLGGLTTNPTLDTMKALAHALNCTLDDIADDMEDKKVDTIAAHHDGYDWTEEELEEIERFKQYVLSKREK